MLQTRSSFIDAHSSRFRAVNEIADLSTSMRLATVKRNYTECVLTFRVILTINDLAAVATAGMLKIFQCAAF